MLKRKNNIRILRINSLNHSSNKNVVTQKYNKKEIYPYLDFGELKNNAKVKEYQVVEATLYRLETGCQWKEPTRGLMFSKLY